MAAGWLAGGTGLPTFVAVVLHQPLQGYRMQNREFVAYYRVSSVRQGESGLGLDAQRASVEAFVKQSGGTILASYVEVESGKRTDRPQLTKALETARRAKATLLIAKLDRLARNLAFIANLMDAGIDFVAVDQAHASRLTLHILSAFAEDEGRRISERTKAALAAAKLRGTRLGGWRGRVASDADRERARAARETLANTRASDLAATINMLRAEGVTSCRALASRLNEMNIPTTGSADKFGRPTAHVGAWHGAQVARIVARIENLKNGA